MPHSEARHCPRARQPVLDVRNQSHGHLPRRTERRLRVRRLLSRVHNGACPSRRRSRELIAESGVDRGSDSGVEVEVRIGSYVRSSQCRIDPSNGQSPVV
jgi:hypothetical protein